MFPVQFDYRILSTLPLPSPERATSVAQLLRAIVMRRVLPYFRNKRGTDPLKLGQVTDRLSILRMEDENNRIRIVSALARSENAWTIQVHERIFDYLSFVIPSDPETRLGDGTPEEQKMLALTELFLRHQLEHMLYPERRERDVILSDADFALDRRAGDPTFYRMLRGALADEMNGIIGRPYLALLDAAETGQPLEAAAVSILEGFASALGDAPDAFLQSVFPWMDTELKSRVLEDHYRRSRDTASSLLQRTHSLRSALRLFDLLMKRDEKEAMTVFHSFKDRWGLIELFKELDLPEKALSNKTPEELLQVFRAGLLTHLDEEAPLPPAQPTAAVLPAQQELRQPTQKSLTDRIEDARNDPGIPARVMEVIEKNKLNAVGHSGSKYSELIETLLAIPWGKIRKIQVSPEAFEAGLNRSHYGLQTPKDILCDFFTNLIWRYQRFTEAEASGWQRTGSAFLMVGPPGVGKTSLAISVAQNLGIPWHKISLGGMRDEAELRGFGFTYEGSKPGAIVQGLIKMEAMNGLFILDEVDKTEKFAIATLLEILDPEQNHLFHDKYTQTTVDVDLSNCHFFLTANTLETVPQVVVNRCEVVPLGRYSVEEKVAIAKTYLMRRIRDKYQIDESQIAFDAGEEDDLLRYLVRNYTYEPGVRELERIIRTLFLRIQRKEILTGGRPSIDIRRETIKEYLQQPIPPRKIGLEDTVGEMLALGVDPERGVGSIIPIQATRIANAAPERRRGYLSIVYATGNLERVMDESRNVAGTGILHWAAELGIDPKHLEEPVHLHFMGGSTRKDGPSAGGAIGLALASVLSGRKIRRDVAMTGEIDTKGRISGIGALALKIEIAFDAGCKTVIIPRENLFGEGGIEQFPQALKEELQILTYEEWSGKHQPFDYARHMVEVVAVDDIVQAARVAFVDDADLSDLETRFASHARELAERLPFLPMRRPDLPELSRGEPAPSPLPGTCVLVLQAKRADEIDPDWLRMLRSRSDCRPVLLILPEIRKEVLGLLGDLADRLPVLDFEHKRQTISSALTRILESLEPPAASPLRLALIAPYFLMKRDGIFTAAPPAGVPDGKISFFANNYTVQQVKLKRSRSLLNRVLSLLALLPPSEVAGCPFLGMSEEAHVVDLSYIPEKYRLDIGRAESILSGSLTRWLDMVSKQANITHTRQE